MENTSRDQFVVCKRCDSALCYQQALDQRIITHLCLSCGFTTSTLMKVGSEVVNNAIATSPELYKDLMYIDNENYVWLPCTLTLPEIGMIFVDGTSKKDWKWKVVKTVSIQKTDNSVKDIDGKVLMDMQNAKTFTQNDFSVALSELGLFK